MRRADRLFQIIQALRRASRPVTAEALALELEISKRTVYRDISALIGQNVPIRGEAGVGYILEGGFDMPPLMLTADEVEAAVLGAQWVAARGDPALARAARDLIVKIAASVPERLRSFAIEPALTASPGRRAAPEDAIDMARLRSWIHERGKLQIRYSDEQGRLTVRVIWPVAVGYFEATRIIAAWCELREDFRHFRTDRIVEARFLDERHPRRPAALRAAWRKSMADGCTRKAEEERPAAPAARARADG
jgi:predicted DNA-binding transcriptional regulator YafY